MPPVGRKHATKFSNPAKSNQHVDELARTRSQSTSAYADDVFSMNIVMPQHPVFPELSPPQGELFFECTLFLYSVLAMFLQYLNLYKTMWWLPHSHTHYTLKFHLIDLYLLSCVGLILGRRVTLCFLKKITFVPSGCENSIPYYFYAIEWSIKLPAVGAILSSFSFSFVQVLSTYSWSSLVYLIYPVLFYVLLFYTEMLCIFCDPSSSSSSAHSANSASANIGTVANSNGTFFKRLLNYVRSPPYYVEPNTGHACSMSPNVIREEVDILTVDFNQRLKQSVFAAFTTAYYAIFIPCCFTPQYLYIDYLWAAELCFVVFSTSWTIYAAYLFPLQYCDLLHRSASHLGAWEKFDKHPPYLAQLQITTWSELYLWPEGSVVKQGRSLYKAIGPCVAAEPGNNDHDKFFVLLNDPMRIINGLCIFEACVIICQFLMLVHSTEWQHIVTLVLLMFANYLLMFKLFKDKVILGRIYHPSNEDLNIRRR